MNLLHTTHPTAPTMARYQVPSRPSAFSWCDSCCGRPSARAAALLAEPPANTPKRRALHKPSFVRPLGGRVVCRVILMTPLNSTMNVVTDALSLHCQRNLWTAAARQSSISTSNAQSYKNGMQRNALFLSNTMATARGALSGPVRRQAL